MVDSLAPSPLAIDSDATQVAITADTPGVGGDTQQLAVNGARGKLYFPRYSRHVPASF